MEARDVLKNFQNFAVIGVTTNYEKYGYKIFKCLKDLGKTVYGVSPIYKEIDAEATFPNLSAINKPVDVAVFVVSPKFGSDYVKECNSLNIKKIWLQPGTYDDNLIQEIKDLELEYYQNCVLVESKNL